MKLWLPLFLISIFLVSCSGNYNIQLPPRLCANSQKLSFELDKQSSFQELKTLEPAKYKFISSQIFLEKNQEKKPFKALLSYVNFKKRTKLPVLKVSCLKNVNPKKAFAYSLKIPAAIQFLELKKNPQDKTPKAFREDEQTTFNPLEEKINSWEEAVQISFREIIFSYEAKPSSQIESKFSIKKFQQLNLKNYREELKGMKIFTTKEKENEIQVRTIQVLSDENKEEYTIINYSNFQRVE